MSEVNVYSDLVFVDYPDDKPTDLDDTKNWADKDEEDGGLPDAGGEDERFFEDDSDSDDDGSRLMRLETVGTGVPVCVLAESGSDLDLTEGERCRSAVTATCVKLKIYDDEDDYDKHNDSHFAPVSLFPMFMGLMSFAGKVVAVEKNPEREDVSADYRLVIETYEMTLTVFANFKGKIRPGNIMSGVAAFTGVVKRVAAAPQATETGE